MKTGLRTFLKYLSALVVVIASQVLCAQEGKNTYVVDVENSRLDWMCGNHKGYIDLKDGYLTLSGNEITAGSFTICMDSIVTLDIEYELMRETLNNLLKSDHYFDSEKYPLSKFTITKSHLIDGNRHCVSGNLRIKDQSHPVTFHAVVDIGENRLSAESEKFFIDRTRWGITTSSLRFVKDKDSFTFSDDIYFVVHLKAEKK
ncbi:MAG: YceI family protein [Bacteroidales bacterium]